MRKFEKCAQRATERRRRLCCAEMCSRMQELAQSEPNFNLIHSQWQFQYVSLFERFGESE